jgi:hypothetical protein
MKFSKLAIALIAAGTLAFAACGKKDEKKEGGDESAEAKGGDEAKGGEETAAKPAEENKDEGGEAAGGEADMEKAWEMMQALAEAAATEGDCKAKAAAMNKVVDDNQELINKAKGFQNDEAMKQKWDEKYGEKSMQLMTKMASEDLKDCMADPDVGAAMKRLAGE